MEVEETLNETTQEAVNETVAGRESQSSLEADAAGTPVWLSELS